MASRFDPTQYYTTVVDIDGTILVVQNGVYYDKYGNSWLAPHRNTMGWEGVHPVLVPRTSAQLAGVPSHADLGLGFQSLFYASDVTPSSGSPLLLYVATATAYVPAGGTGGGGSGTVKSINNINPDGSGNVALTALSVQALPQAATNTWNASTNTPTLTSSTIPGSGILAYTVSVAGTTTLDGISTWNVGDVVYQTGTVWARAANNPITTLPVVGDGTGGLIAGTLGVNYGAPITIQCCVEIYRAGSGSMGNNGALTLTNALPSTLSRGCWMEFPAGAIATGIPSSAQVTAGVKWWTVMSSTTAGTVYNNTYTPGTTLPTAIPASPTAFSTTGPGAYTNNISASPAYIITVPANTLGNNGSIDYEIWASSYSANTNAKTVSSTFGGSGEGANINMTNNAQQALLGNFINQANPKQQKSSQAGKSFSGNQSKNFSTVDTTLSQNFVITFNTAVAGDYVCIESLKLTITGAP